MSVDSGSATPAARLGIKPGMVVQELGWDEDVDEDRSAPQPGQRDDLLVLVGEAELGRDVADGEAHAPHAAARR